MLLVTRTTLQPGFVSYLKQTRELLYKYCAQNSPYYTFEELKELALHQSISDEFSYRETKSMPLELLLLTNSNAHLVKMCISKS